MQGEFRYTQAEYLLDKTRPSGGRIPVPHSRLPPIRSQIDSPTDSQQSSLSVIAQVQNGRIRPPVPKPIRKLGPQNAQGGSVIQIQHSKSVR